MIEHVYGIEPSSNDMVGGCVAVQYDRTGADMGVGITLNRAALEKYLREYPEPSGLGTPANPDEGLVFFVRLERPQVNRLVRLLRKGRDLTFGRDE